MCGSLCRYSYTNSALSRRVLLPTLNNNGDCFMESSILSMKRKLREVYECSNECTAVGTCVKDLCLMKYGYYQRLYMGKMGQGNRFGVECYCKSVIATSDHLESVSNRFSII